MSTPAKKLEPAATETIAFQGKMFQIVHQKMTDGTKDVTFEIARRAPGCRIIFDHDHKILLTREYRYELGQYDYRLPGGKVFDRLSDYQTALDSGTDMLSAAQNAAHKEAVEEVGLKPEALSFVRQSRCGATVVWDLYFFVCTSFAALSHTELESGEDIAHDWYTYEDVRRMCLDGSMDEERSAITLLKYLSNK